MEQQTKICQNCKNKFTIEPEDFVFYEKIKVPPPTFCPDCRLQRRLAFRNERTLYKRNCGLCGKSHITIHREGGNFISYCSPCYWSDQWNSLDYGRDYDFSRPFFEQFQELMRAIPNQNISVSYQTLVNSEYNNMNHHLKNCYWLFNSDYDENCSYGEEAEGSKDCIDITMVDHSELIYQSVNCNHSFRIFYSADIISSQNIWFSKNLVNCHDCFGCASLQNRQYYIFNKPYTKEYYEKKIKEVKPRTYQQLKELQDKIYKIWLQVPYKYIHGTHNINVTGDYIYNCKNTHNSFIATESENCKYCIWLIAKNNKDCYDFSQFGENTLNVYEALICGKGINNVIVGMHILESHDVSYSSHCLSNCSNIFGCIGLRNKQYCILNKQYSKQDYENLITKIIQHMNDMPYVDKKGIIYKYGEFFPSELSPFAYNETTADEFFPLTKKAILESGFVWTEKKKKDYKITKSSDDIPDEFENIDDSILNDIIACQHQGKCNEMCTTAFRIIPYELEFYRRFNIPLPRLCPNCRHYQRLKQRNPFKLWHRKCQCSGQESDNKIYKNTVEHFHKNENCPNEFETSYSPDRKEIVYCEACYQQEVI